MWRSGKRREIEMGELVNTGGGWTLEAEWTTKAGFPAYAMRSPERSDLEMTFSIYNRHRFFRCGYVVVPETHPRHTKGERLMSFGSMTDGINFSNETTYIGPPHVVGMTGTAFGFDCNHLWHIERYEPESLDRVRYECEELAMALKAVGEEEGS